MPAKNNQQLIHQDNGSGPLLSWDIFMDGYWKKMTLGDDKLQLDKLAKNNVWQQQWNMETKLLKEGKIILVTDPNLQIVFASSNITNMNGYTPAEVIGQTPRMFQGKETDENIKNGIREAVEKWQHFHVSIVNYKKSGETYNCTIDGYPIFNKQKKVVNFIAFETTAAYDY